MPEVFKREIWFGGHRYEPCHIVYCETNDIGTITGKYMIARKDDGSEHVVTQGYGTWMAIRPMDLVGDLKERDRLREEVGELCAEIDRLKAAVGDATQDRDRAELALARTRA